MSARFFGVGCMVPSVIDADDPASWTKQTKDAFDAIPSVQNFRILDVSDLNFCWTGDGYDDPEKKEVHIPESGVIAFEVKIPMRLQAMKLLESDEVETFRVTTLFDYVHPVTFIECVDAPGDVANPSMALVVVREFLRDELKKRNSPADLLTLGPSPFHADFFLRVGDEGRPAGEGFRVEVEKTLSYDQVTYFSDSLDSLWALYSSIQEQFSYFYRFTMLRNVRLGAAENLSRKSQDLVKTFKLRGFRAYISRNLTMRHSLQSVQLDAVSARLEIIHHKRDNVDDLERLYPGDDETYLKGHLEKTMGEDYIEEIESSEKILTVLEGRHSQELQRFTTVTFSLVGVIVGAFLTAAFRSWWG
ncbi:hypothetical protein [Streptomyces sp. V2I9]|uniref:hypothetical protein n=1 Tax=Streptomyces sp. V2I9 TaxID=3042304 RepID=UPI00277DBCFD|nr:hypothetical protein [Streptomyces sp. V2I9]MDQ0985960.1 hypothetical protein [Streptomyces sp. V2I9]